jgi:hypothetical protein
VSIASSGKRLVAVGDHGAIYTSPDGASWMDVRDRHGNGSLKYRDYYSSVIWTGTKFAAVGGQGVLAVSTDGIAWSLSFPAYLYSIVYAKRQFIGVGNNSNIEQSPDGVTWKKRDGFPASTVARIIPAGSGYLGLAGYAVLSSKDGMAWSYQLFEHGVYAQQHSYDNVSVIAAGIAGSGNGYVAVGAEGGIISSKDGTKWTAEKSGTDSDLFDVIWTGTQYVAVGDGGCVLVSKDGTSWKLSVVEAADRGLSCIATSGKIIVAGGPYGSLITSPDGNTWTETKRKGGGTTVDVEWGNGTFVAIGGYGAIMTSQDGISWTQRNSTTQDNLRSIAWTGWIFLAVGENGTALQSADGVEWTPVDLPFPRFAYDLVSADGKRLFIAGEAGVILTSP